MPKKKKTRKQKIQADSRHTTESAALPSEQIQTYSVAKKEVISPKVTSSSTTTIATSDYRYLSKDLLKTVLLTISIIIIELVLQRLTKGV